MAGIDKIEDNLLWVGVGWSGLYSEEVRVEMDGK